MSESPGNENADCHRIHGLFPTHNPTHNMRSLNATLAFTSNNVSAGLLIIEIQADSVNTGSGMKNGKLEGKDFFDVKENPLITFKSTKIEQTGPNDFSVDGDFTIRGVTKHERLTLTVSGKGTESGTIAGIMAFDRKE